jgi:uncharacterized protein YndB with AHSA1/START domain
MNEITARVRIAAPIDDVWAKLSHHEAMPDWSPLSRVTLEREGNPDRDGLGAVRVMKAPGPAPRIKEEVTLWEPPSYYEYVLTAGAPIRDHLGRVELAESDGQTSVTWHIQFRPLVPGTGWLIARMLDRAINGMLRRARRQLEG